MSDIDPHWEFASLADMLASKARSRPHECAYVFLDGRGNVAERRTFAQLDAAAGRIAAILCASGFTGKPVVLAYPDGLDFIDALFGCFYAGCIAVPAPYMAGRRGTERLDAICGDSSPAAMLTLSRLDEDAAVRGVALHDVPGFRIRTDRLDHDPRPFVRPPLDSSALALLQYTSGSTSAPKGVMLTHANLLANSAMVRDAFGHDAHTRGASWLPLFHDMGLIGHVVNSMHFGGLSVLMSPLTFLQRPLIWLKAISDWRATVSGGPTYAFDLCLRRITPEQAAGLDLSSWTVAYCGSERVHADVLDRFAERFAKSGFRRDALYPCYGLAEATLFVTGGKSGGGTQSVAAASAGAQPIVSCGQAWHDEKVRIVDPDAKAPLSAGSVGEIWVSGANVGQGYWQRPAESQMTFKAQLGSDGDTYLRTGDLGFVRDGALYVIGRLKDTIIIRGVNHAAEDIEATVAASHRAFAEHQGAAFGVEIAGDEHLIVVQEIASFADEAVQNAAAELAFESITRAHGIRLYDLVLVRAHALPRTLNGKKQRQRCRDLYQAGGFQRLNARESLRWLGTNLERSSGATPVQP